MKDVERQITASAGPALYLVGTPIGNLEDITLRALRVLKEVDVIACEDTRQTQKLLNHYAITTRTTSYHEHNEITKSAELVKEMQEGANVALVTDAGMPGISDPGYRLISLAIRHRVPVVPIPGASAFLAALVASGLPTDSFRFSGFLPAKRGERQAALEAVRRSVGELKGARGGKGRDHAPDRQGGGRRRSCGDRRSRPSVGASARGADHGGRESGRKGRAEEGGKGAGGFEERSLPGVAEEQVTRGTSLLPRQLPLHRFADHLPIDAHASS
jgi:precorrin-6B methylase 1